MTVFDYGAENSSECRDDALDILELLLAKLEGKGKSPEEIVAHITMVGSAILGSILLKYGSKNTEKECCDIFKELTIGFADYCREMRHTNLN
jgi:hypothetical protein